MRINDTVGTHEVSHATFKRFEELREGMEPLEIYEWFHRYINEKGLSHVNLTYNGKTLATVTNGKPVVPEVANLLTSLNGNLIAFRDG